MVCSCDPHTLKSPFDDVLEKLKPSRRTTRSLNDPLNELELLDVATFFKSEPAARLADLYLELGYWKKNKVGIKEVSCAGVDTEEGGAYAGGEREDQRAGLFAFV